MEFALEIENPAFFADAFSEAQEIIQEGKEDFYVYAFARTNATGTFLLRIGKYFCAAVPAIRISFIWRC
jgi:hypothetical protein